MTERVSGRAILFDRTPQLTLSCVDTYVVFNEGGINSGECLAVGLIV